MLILVGGADVGQGEEQAGDGQGEEETGVRTQSVSRLRTIRAVGVGSWVCKKKWGTGFGRGLANPAIPVPVLGVGYLTGSDPS
jgi:hypothetical protein